MLAIASGELKPDQKMPSTRELARRFNVHSNTVNAAYRELAKEGWLEFRKGSGVYVHRLDKELPLKGELELDQMISNFLQVTRSKGFSLAEIRRRVKSWLEFQTPDHFLLIEPDLELRDILIAEIRAAISFRCLGVSFEECTSPEVLIGAVPIAIYGRADKVREILPSDTACIFLKTRSVQEEVQKLNPLHNDSSIAVISRWPDFLKWARAILTAAGVDPASLSFRSACESGWEKGLSRNTVVISDVLQAKEIPAKCQRMEFGLIAESSLEELQIFVSRFLCDT
jgi:GntR family transcriptional regulator